MVNTSKTIRIDKSMIEKLKRIMEQESERGNDCSWRIASKILSKRIDNVGGLK